MILSDTESLCRKLDFLLLMHTEGSGKLNISMQLVATSSDLVLNIFTNAPTTTYSKDLKSADERGTLLGRNYHSDGKHLLFSNSCFGQLS